MKTNHRTSVLLSALVLCGVFAGRASAALKKYDLTVRSQTNSPSVSPNPNVSIAPNLLEDSVALLDAAGGPNPVLRKLVRAQDFAVTTLVPALLVNVFVSANFREGPGVLQQIHGNPVAAFTGTGNTAAGTTIRWATVTGWTLSGSLWCHASPSVICTLAMLTDQDTADPRFNSEFYDLGTWIFHGTGFTASPFIAQSVTTSFGNTTLWIRGFRKQDGTVPALPLLGIALLGASLFGGGIVALSRQRNP